jgi:hypothetical protein
MLRVGIMFLFLSTFGLITLVEITASSAPSSGPFDPYQALRPGAPNETLDQFSCPFLYTMRRASQETTYCRLYPLYSSIKSVHIISKDHQIRRVIFLMDGVVLGHLVEVWGRPDEVWQERGETIACWQQGIRAKIRVNTWRLSYHSPVRHLTLVQLGTSADLIQVPAGHVCDNGTH